MKMRLQDIFNRKVDLINDSIPRIISCVGLPVMISIIISIIAGIVNNSIFSAYCPEYFPVYAILVSICLFINTYFGSFASALWSFFSKSFVNKTEDKNKNIFTCMMTLLIMQLFLILLVVVSSDWVLSLLNTPEEIYQNVKIFYLTFSAFSLFLSFSNFSIRLVTGLETPFSIFIIRIVNTALPSLILFLFIGVFKLGILGASMYLGVAGLFEVALSILILSKHHAFSHNIKYCKNFDWKSFFKVVRYSTIMILQSVLCTIGYLFVVSQTNKYLSDSLDFIFVLGVTFPITNGFSIFSALIETVIPPNYMSKKFDRTKKIFAVLTAGCLIYGIFVMLFYVFAGKAYFSSICPGDANKIALGAESWTYLGIGYFFVSFLFSFRMFFSSILRVKTAMFCGLCEFIANVVSAFWLIPQYGRIGRNLSTPLGYVLGAIYLVIIYLICRKKIYSGAYLKADNSSTELTEKTISEKEN